MSVGTEFGKAQGCRPNREYLRPKKVALSAITAEGIRNDVPGRFAGPIGESAPAKLKRAFRTLRIQHREKSASNDLAWVIITILRLQRPTSRG